MGGARRMAGQSFFGRQGNAAAGGESHRPVFRIGELLVRAGHLSDEGLERALAVQRAAPDAKLLGALLVELGMCSEDAVAQALALQLGVAYVPEVALTASLGDVERLGVDLCWHREILPVRSEDGSYVLAMSDPFQTELATLAEEILGEEVAPAAATRSAILARIGALTGTRDPFEEALEQSLAAAERGQAPQAAASATGFVPPVFSQIMAQAVEEHASAVHLTPAAGSVIVEFLTQGALREVFRLPKGLGEPLTSYIDEVARAGEGGGSCITLFTQGGPIDFAYYRIAGEHGDRCVLQAPESEEPIPPLGSIGLTDEQFESVHGVLEARRGCMIVAGPPNSGVTTTLYSCLSYLTSQDLRVVTIEPATEWYLPGVEHVSLAHVPGKTTFFALRALLSRQPDVIMVGDIRDRETADMALRAGLTGPLVLAGLHATTAGEVVVRLRELGIGNRVIAAGLELVIAQRLVGGLCPACSTGRALGASERFLLEQVLPDGAPGSVPIGAGCAACGGTGRARQQVLAETMVFSGPVRSAILQGQSAAAVGAAAREQGMASLFKTGVRHALDGHCDLRDVVQLAPLPVKPKAVRPAREGSPVGVSGRADAVAPVRPLGPLPRQKTFDTSPEADGARFREFCAALNDLPTIPHAVARLQSMLMDPGVETEAVIQVIEADPVVTARVIRMANSAAFGMRRDIVSVRDAVALLGFVQVWNVAVATHLIDAFGTEAEVPVPLSELWVHSLATSICARNLERSSGSKHGVELATLAGLLHDIGKVIMALHLGPQFAGCIETARAARTPLWQVERDRLGFTHAHVGEWVLERWSLPREVSLVVRHHHTPDALPEDVSSGTERMSVLVRLADDAVKAAGIGHSADYTAVTWTARQLQDIGIPPALVAPAVLATVRSVPAILDLCRRG